MKRALVSLIVGVLLCAGAVAQVSPGNVGVMLDQIFPVGSTVSGPISIVSGPFTGMNYLKLEWAPVSGSNITGGSVAVDSQIGSAGWVYGGAITASPVGTAGSSSAGPITANQLQVDISVQGTGSVRVRLLAGLSAIGGSGGGTTTKALTFNNSGSGAASGTTFNGSTAITISANTVGAIGAASPTFTGIVTLPDGTTISAVAWSLGSPLALPTGSTAITQSSSDNSLDVATDQFVQNLLSGISSSGANNALQMSNGSGGFNNTAPPSVNGVYPCGYVVTASASVPLTCTLAGVPIDATNPATLLYSDRQTYIKWTSGTTLTLPAISGQFGTNMAFVIQNLAGATVAITPTTPNNIDGGSSQAASSLLPNWTAFVYSDTAGPNWYTIKIPNFAGFGSGCANALNFSTTTGFGCNSVGVDSGTATAYVITGTGITANAISGTIACFTPLHSNTGAGPTIAFNGQTATTITKANNLALVAADIVINDTACVLYNGVNYTLLNPNTGTGTGKVVYNTNPTIGGTLTVTNISQFIGANSVMLTTATTISSTSPVTTGLVLPIIPVSTTINGRCHLGWSQSTAVTSVQFAFGMNNAPTDLWVLPPHIWNGTTETRGSATTITSNSVTAITPSIVAAAAGTEYGVDFDFTMTSGATNAVTLTLYGVVATTAADSLVVAAGSSCGWLP